MAGDLIQAYLNRCKPFDWKTSPVTSGRPYNADKEQPSKFSSGARLTTGVQKDTFVGSSSSVSEEEKEIAKSALSAIPGIRRVVAISDNKNNGDVVKAVGLTGIALINLKEDLRDILIAIGKGKSAAPDGYLSKFGFFTGTALEPYLVRKKWGGWILDNCDRTLGDTRLAKKLFKLLKVTEHEEYFEKEIHLPGDKKEILNRVYVKFDGPKFGRKIGNTLKRIPVIGLGIVGLLELPKIVKSVKEKGDYKQIIRSGITAGLTVTTGALMSVLLAPLFPAAGTIVGLGLGGYLGSKAAKSVNEKI